MAVNDKIAKLGARLILYEDPNAPSSTELQFNHKHNKYPKKHGVSRVH